MTWPPPLPAADITNVTDQNDRHPADHNQIAEALESIVENVDPVLGRASGAGGGGSVGTGNTTFATVTIPTTGQWSLFGKLEWDLSVDAAGRTYTAELWDGTTVLDSVRIRAAATSDRNGVALLFRGTITADTVVVLRARASATGGTALASLPRLVAIAG